MSLFAPPSPENEPMTLGSPPTSPGRFGGGHHPLSSPFLHSRHSPGKEKPAEASFAPGFLLGGGAGRGPASPMGLPPKDPAAFATPPPLRARSQHMRTVSPRGERQVTWSPKLVEYEGATKPSPGPMASLGRPAHQPRPAGPPLRSLRSLQTSRAEEEHSAAADSSLWHAAEEDSAMNVTAAEVDPFYSQGPDLQPSRDLDPRVVTVFGFPPEAADSVLKEFSALGTVVHCQRSAGNWLHLGYQSRLQASAALAKNTKVLLGGRVMVGVTGCIDVAAVGAFRRAAEESGQEDAGRFRSPRKTLTEAGDGPPLFMSPRAPSAALRSTQASPAKRAGPGPATKLGRAQSLREPRERPRMRNLAAQTRTESPLASSFRQHNASVAEDPHNSSLLSSTWNYLFGAHGDK